MEQDNLRMLLCTDMDRTLIPNGAAVEDPRARALFKSLCRYPEVVLVYVTGRDQVLVHDALQFYDLPQPDYAITDVGSTIYQVTVAGWRVLEAWSLYLEKDWPQGTDQRIRSLLAGTPGPILQEETKQNIHKVSYYLSLQQDVQQIMGQIRELLDLERIPANLIWSLDEIKNVGLLDILPAAADKRLAIDFLQRRLGYHHDEVLFAGDSGNDLSVINSDICSILVANAALEVKQAALEWAHKNGHRESLYIASGDLLSMNGNYSAGILEGVFYFRPTLRHLLTGDTA